MPSAGACAVCDDAEAAALSPLPAPDTVAAAGPPSLIPSFGFHVWSLGKLVPGDVCLPCPVAPWNCCGGGGGRRGDVLEAEDGGGGCGGFGGFEAYVRSRIAEAGIIGDACRR